MFSVRTWEEGRLGLSHTEHLIQTHLVSIHFFMLYTFWYLRLVLVMTKPPHVILCSHWLPPVFYGVKGFMLTTSPSITALTQGWGCHLAGSTSVIYGANTNAPLVYQRVFSRSGLLTVFIMCIQSVLMSRKNELKIGTRVQMGWRCP